MIPSLLRGGGPIALGLIAAFAAVSAQEPPRTADGQQPVFRTGVRVVRVDVTVTGKGERPVDDLTVEDFTLEEDGTPQTIDSVQFVRLSGERADGDQDSLEIRSPEHAEAEAAREDVRVFAVFFDDYHVDKAPSVMVPLRSAMQAFVQGLGPTDLIALMDPLTPLSALRFTRDKAAVLDAVKKWEGRQGEFFPVRSVLEEAQYQARNVRMVRAEVSLSALNALVARLGSLREGRKSIIYVSQGPPTLFGMDGDVEHTMRDLLRNASRGNVTIHTLDPRGLGKEGRGGIRDTLFRLAGETGGRPIVNTNGLEQGLEKVVTYASAYYVLGYTPTREKDDGEFHKIKVDVRRPGTRVVSRKGYWAPSEEAVEKAEAEAAKPKVPGVADALSAMSTSRTGRTADVWVGFDAAGSGARRVRITWEPAASLPQGAQGPTRLAVEVVSAESGDVLVPAVEIASSRGIVTEGAVATLDVPTANATFRFTATSADGDVLDRWTQPIEIPSAEESLGIGTLAFWRARSPVEARRLREAADAAPAATRRFVRTDRVRVEAALPPDLGDATATAELLNKAGDRLASLPVEVRAGLVRLEMPLTSVAPSTYLLRVRVTAGERQAEQVAAFEVVP